MEKLLKSVIAGAVLIAAAAFTLTFSRAEEHAIRIPLHASEVNLDPTGVQDSASLWVSRQINCQLVRQKGRNFVPEAASEIRYLSPTAIHLSLNSGAKFHDGSPVKAEDVVATFDHLNHSRKVLRNIFTWVKRVRAVDDHTVSIELTEAVPQFLKFIGAPNYAIYKKEFIAKAEINPRLWSAPLGCGGYKVAGAMGADGVIHLTPVRPGAIPVEFQLRKENGLTTAESRAFDLVGVPYSEHINATDVFREEGIFDPKQLLIGLNTELPRWKEKKARCEFLHSLNRQHLLDQYGKSAELATSIFPRGVLGYHVPNTASSHDAAGVAGAGSPKRKGKVCLSFLGVSVPTGDRAAYVEMLKELYGDVESQVVDNPKEYGADFLKSKCDAFILGLKSNYLDGYEYLLSFSEKSANFTGYWDPKLVKAVQSSQDEENPTLRSSTYQAIEREINDRCLLAPLITLPMKKTLVRRDLKTPGIGEVPPNEYYLGDVR